MDLQTRKIEFIKVFLELENEEIIILLDNTLTLFRKNSNLMTQDAAKVKKDITASVNFEPIKDVFADFENLGDTLKSVHEHFKPIPEYKDEDEILSKHVLNLIKKSKIDGEFDSDKFFAGFEDVITNYQKELNESGTKK
jgi:hypothetical protein